ncbi:sphingomyelin phosphodiesterase [Aethina tumida]|uniref:sphingomyelin phosphodiesterase n=1 Tax=Aethina tumida TaxID=116153 RepID=UPI002148280D|nr:sphingomyelin phosphodiesterase [Aethina tumida]
MNVIWILAVLTTAYALDQTEILQNIRRITKNLLTSPYDDDDTTLNEIRFISNKTLKNEIICKSCDIIMDHIISYRRAGANKGSMKKCLKNLCVKYTDWGLIACDGYVEIEIDTILFIIDNKRNLTPARICAIHLQTNKCVDPDADKWTINIPPISDTIDDDEVTHVNESEAEASALKILHLTDIHYDPDYNPGSNAVCDEPLCCVSGTPNSTENAAGFWGDYHVCDMPWHSILDLTHRIRNEKYDLVYFTGDIISHRSWVTSKEKNTESIKLIYKLFNTTFPNTKVYPILGNHEPHPTDFYSPESLSRTKISTQWVFDLVAEEWAHWLPIDTKLTLQHGGFYTVLVKPGFRIIGINSNVCFISNLWLMYDDRDPNDQLQWLVNTLLVAEKNKEKVHLLSHIPPGELNCHIQWSNQFKRVIQRFSRTISAQFNGHTHFDEIRIFYDETKKDKVTNVAFNGGSFTTFVGLNPNYRVYSVNKDNLRVLDYDEYTYNLTEANLSRNTEPRWFKLYSFKQAYGLNSMDYNSMNTFVDILRRNMASLKEYYKNYIRDSDGMEECEEECLKKVFCSITAVETKDAIDC